MSVRHPPDEIFRPLKAWANARNQSLDLLANANSDDEQSAKAVSVAILKRLAAAELALGALLDLHVDSKGNWIYS